MKKFLSLGLIAIVFVAFTFVSCVEENDDNNETTKTEESEDNKSNETSKNKETDQKTKKKLLLKSFCEYTTDGKKYNIVTEYKYNENGDEIYVEKRINGNLSVQIQTDYKYDGNIVSYTLNGYVNGEKSSTSYIKTEYKYNDNGEMILKETYINGKLSAKLTDYNYNYNYNGNVISYTQYNYNGGNASTTSVKTETKFNDNGEIILKETYVNGSLSTKQTDYSYNENVVTYTMYYTNGSPLYYKEEYNN